MTVCIELKIRFCYLCHSDRGFFLELNKVFLVFIYAQICCLRASCTRASASVPCVPSTAIQAVERATSVVRNAAATVAEIISIPSDFELHAYAVPWSQTDPIWLRQTAVTGSSVEETEVRKSSSSHIHTDDQNAGCIRSFLEFSRTHIFAIGRHH